MELTGAMQHVMTSKRDAAWRDRLLDWRDRLLASPRFQRWASMSPLTRRIARRRARVLFDIAAGFVYSQVLFACVKLKLFELVREPQSAKALAARLSMPHDSMQRLLSSAASLKLIEQRSDGRYGLGPHGAALLANPGVIAMIGHHAMLYADLKDPVALLRDPNQQTELRRFWSYADSENAADYTALMSASQQLIAHDVLSAYSLERHRRLLDVGGGDGTFLSAAAARAPQLELMLFDLPSVAEQARTRMQDARIEIVGGNFHTDPLPLGADVISLVRVVHDHDDDAALRLLRAVRTALPVGGVLLLAEPMAETPGAETVGAYFNFYLLAMGSGRPRTASELTSMLRAAGFSRIEFPNMQQPLQTRLAVAHVGGDQR